jgi:polyhydroxybutyrate depolymerase
MSTLHRAVLLALFLVACGGGGGPGGGDDDDDDGPPTVFGGDRPVTLEVPNVVAGQTYPLVLILHGYGATGLLQEAYFGLGDLADRGEAFVLAPDGNVDSNNKQFWNADTICCDLDHTNPDDVGYLGKLIDDVMAAYPIDPKNVRLVGHSNGGFMAYRMACERADVVSNIAVLAGDAVTTPCTPTRSVHVLHMHGTSDEVVPFSGAQPSIDEWADHNGCGSGLATKGAAFDLDEAVVGPETSAAVINDCPATAQVELWTMGSSTHVPNITTAFDAAISQWWRDHPAP